jgi:Ni/Fe-hydrogenase subunit HybB-like protein
MATNLQVDRPSTSSVPVLNRRMALVLLGMLVAVGALAGVIRLLAGLGSTTNLVDSYTWGVWIGFDFTLIAFAGAGFTMAALVHVLRQHQYHDAVRPAILAGLFGYVAVLLLLVLDLGRPDRFYNFILFWNPHSPLFEISWCVLLYTTVLLIETSPFLLERLHMQRLLKLTGKIMLVVAIAGVTLSSLHQSTLGTLYLNMPYRLHPLWFAPLLPLMFFTSAVMAGLSMAVLTYVMATRITRREAKPEIVRGLALLAGWAGAIYLALKVGDLLISGELPLVFTAGSYSMWWWIEIGIGLILPVTLLLVPALRKRSWVPIVAPLLMLFGVLMNRFNATMYGQILPPGTSYSPHLLEWLSTIGVLAAGVLAWVIGIRLLVIFDSKFEKH